MVWRWGGYPLILCTCHVLVLCTCQYYCLEMGDDRLCLPRGGELDQSTWPQSGEFVHNNEWILGHSASLGMEVLIQYIWSCQTS